MLLAAAMCGLCDRSEVPAHKTAAERNSRTTLFRSALFPHEGWRRLAMTQPRWSAGLDCLFEWSDISWASFDAKMTCLLCLDAKGGRQDPLLVVMMYTRRQKYW
jgi:hypothetical protein